MTVVSVTALTIKPDRYRIRLGAAARNRSRSWRSPAPNVGSLWAWVAGWGSWVAAHEADDHATSGAIWDKFLADSEGLALMMESGTDGGPTAAWQTSTWVEIPL